MRTVRDSLNILRYRWPLSGPQRVLIAAVAFLAFAAAVTYCRLNPTAHVEHGPLENFQAITLAVSAIVLASAAFYLSQSQRLLALGLALFCFVFLLLEFDTRAFNNPTLRRLTNGFVRNLWVGALVAFYAMMLWRKRREVIDEFGQWLRARAGLLMLIAGGFWIVSAVFEHGKFFSDSAVTLILEEVVEINATLFMAWSAFETVKLLKRPASHPAPDGAASTPATPP